MVHVPHIYKTIEIHRIKMKKCSYHLNDHDKLLEAIDGTQQNLNKCFHHIWSNVQHIYKTSCLDEMIKYTYCPQGLTLQIFMNMER